METPNADEVLIFRISPSCSVKLLFFGGVTPYAIENLIALLQIQASIYEKFAQHNSHPVHCRETAGKGAGDSNSTSEEP